MSILNRAFPVLIASEALNWQYREEQADLSGGGTKKGPEAWASRQENPPLRAGQGSGQGYWVWSCEVH